MLARLEAMILGFDLAPAPIVCHSRWCTNTLVEIKIITTALNFDEVRMIHLLMIYTAKESSYRLERPLCTGSKSLSLHGL